MNNQLTGSLLSEAAVLGAIISNPEAMSEAVTLLDKEDFADERHRWIWRAAKYLYDKKTPITIVTLTEMLNRYKKLEESGGIGYMTELAASFPFASEIHAHAKAVKRESYKRKGMQLASDIVRLTQEDDFDTAEEYFTMIDSLVSGLRPTTNTGNMLGYDETEDEYFAYLESKDDNIMTGFRSFDEWSGGIGRGWLYVMAGEPGVGKTAKALQMAAHIAGQQVGQVLFWSQEMSRNQVKNRQLSSVTGVNYSRIRRKELEPHEKDILRKAHRKLAETPLYVEDSSGITINHIENVARQRDRQYGQIGAIFVDYLTRMSIKQKPGETWSRAVGEVAKRFKWLAQEMNCPVFLLAQLNREGHQGKPALKNLRDSGEIEQEADVVEFLWKDPEDTSPDGTVVQSSIAKGREIGVADFRYIFKGWIQRYEEG